MKEFSEQLKTARGRKEIVSRYFYFFWLWYFPHYHQGNIPAYKAEQCLAPNISSRILIIDARGHGKSVLWSNAYPLWVALTNPYRREVQQLPSGGFRYERGDEEIIAQLSNTGPLGEMWIRNNRWELEHNKLLIADWGYKSTRNMKDGKWEADEIPLLNGAQIYSKGSGAQIRGWHPTTCIVDDLENREEAAKPEQREKKRLYFFADVHGALKADSKLIVVGTIVHPEGLLKQLYDRQIVAPVGLETATVFEEPWKKFFYQAIVDGKPIAPEFWSYEALMLKKAELMSQGMLSVWYSEYLNKPRVGENPIFIDSFFEDRNSYDSRSESFQDETLPNFTDLITFTDPAAKDKERNDYTGIVTIGFKRAKRPKIYVLQVKKFRKLLPGQIDEVLKTWNQYRSHLYFEDVAYQAVLESTLATMCEEAGYNVKSEGVAFREEKVKGKPRAKLLDKVARAQKTIHFFTDGQIYFDHNDPAQEDLIEGLKSFPEAQYDDIQDALFGCLWVAQQRLKYLQDQDVPFLSMEADPDTGRPIMAIRHKNVSGADTVPFDLD